MPNTPVRAAAEGVPVISRRYFLTNTVAAGAAVAAVAVPAVAQELSANLQKVSQSTAVEKPRLIELAAQMSDAQAALATAQDRVDWIVVEWRHLWPLAQEQILHCANMHEYSSSHAVIERDLAGNPMMRDIEPLTMRLSPEFRRQVGKTCFLLCTVQFAEERLLHFAANPPTGRTPKALARNVALRAERVRDWTAKLEAARKYEVETARIRELSGIEAAIPQVEAAGKRVQALLAEIMQEPAHTMEGLRIKLRLIQQYVLSGPNAATYAKMRSIPMGWIGPFAEDVAGIIGEADIRRLAGEQVS